MALLRVPFGDRRHAARFEAEAAAIERRQHRIAQRLAAVTHRSPRLELVEAYRRADARIAQR